MAMNQADCSRPSRLDTHFLDEDSHDWEASARGMSIHSPILTPSASGSEFGTDCGTSESGSGLDIQMVRRPFFSEPCIELKCLRTRWMSLRTRASPLTTVLCRVLLAISPLPALKTTNGRLKHRHRYRASIGIHRCQTSLSSQQPLPKGTGSHDLPNRLPHRTLQTVSHPPQR